MEVAGKVAVGTAGEARGAVGREEAGREAEATVVEGRVAEAAISGWAVGSGSGRDVEAGWEAVQCPDLGL